MRSTTPWPAPAPSARAGESPPVIAHCDGPTEPVDTGCGPTLGSAEGPPFATTHVALSEGDILALCTPAIHTASAPAHAPDALRCRTCATRSSIVCRATPAPATPSSCSPAPTPSPPITAPPGLWTRTPQRQPRRARMLTGGSPTGAWTRS
ncbi:SpoIIE family protein phosphatase [Streptomyces sp. NPDC046931]|uniref:SpoIIE family protein phosphatase n=1 Tax=Streptomyces sp. NPDC046931 TaxID=3154806 RepID=UPI0033CC3825